MEKTKKMKIGNENYTFKMTNRTILKVDEKYGNYAKVLKGIMEGEQFYTNAIKMMSCSCVEKEFELEELTDLLTPEQINYEIGMFVAELYYGYIGINEEKTEEVKGEKN